MKRVYHPVNIYDSAVIGDGTKVGMFAEIGENVRIGKNCKIGKGAFIPRGVTIGDNVFIGPHAVFCNDKHPRTLDEWECLEIVVEDGASIGANCTILPGVRIGSGAMIGAGSVVTKNVDANTTVYGNPAIESYSWGK